MFRAEAPLQEWLETFMAREALPPGFAATARDVCEPLARRIAGEARGAGWLVGVCGAQGSGKSTVCAVTAAMLGELGFSAAVLSLDDLYLTRAERGRLAAGVHPLLATRGVPGTHDVGLGLGTLEALRGEGEVALPRFDKGADDRRPQADWPRVDAPVDVILFEGWCVGARPQPAADLKATVNALERDEDPQGIWRGYVNDQLAGPYRALFDRLDLFVLLQAPSFEVVLDWRREQEAKLRERIAREGGGGRAMDDDAVARFIAHYERLTRWILAEAPARADVVVRLDADRRPILEG